MTLVWMFTWWVQSTPGVVFAPDPNGWAFWLILAAAVDLSSSKVSL